jgi:Mg-chelatase subunit ChlD/TolB-like protein
MMPGTYGVSFFRRRHVMKKLIIIVSIFLFSLLPLFLWAGSKKEAEAPAQRGKYLAERGVIVPPEEVYIDSYIAHIDYRYPKPESDIGITLYAGHRQISSRGQEEIIQIGIQGKELSFEELPPMNLAFVIDKSGSMRDQEKMEWVKESFYIFIDKVREKDFVSLIYFDNRAETVFPSTRMDSQYKRERFKDEVYRVRPGGGTNLMDGVKLGYKEVLSNYRKEYVNRVLVLSDGMATTSTTGLLEMAQRYSGMGINISTIGVGKDFDLQLMNNLAHRGGGSSRFISDREQMEKTFGTELDRMVVPIAKDVEMKLEFLQNVEVLATWGYENRIYGNSISYYLSSLHHRDYETILAHIRIPPLRFHGEQDLARFSMEYRDEEGNSHSRGPYYLTVNFVEVDYPVTGFSDAMVLRSGTMLHFSQALKRVGELYYSGQTQRALDLTVATKKEVVNTRLRLDDIGFDDEIKILDNYIRIFSGDLAMSDAETTRKVMEEEIAPPVRERSLHEHIENLFREITLDLGSRIKGTIAISGFSTEEGKKSDLVTLLNETALLEVAKHKTVQVVERDRLDMVLKEQEYALSDLMDTEKAIQVGKLLTVHHILTGSVIEMPNSVVIFGRIINVETGEIESVAQVIVTKNREVNALL